MLINVAPPKPTRLLSETERKVLLMHDLSPGTPGSQESQKVPLFESRNSTLNNGQDLYNMHWDMLNEDLLLSLEKENLFPDLYEFPKLELDMDTSWIQAPLASPEILSTSSSLGKLSHDSSFKKKSVSSTSVRLETIQQSPDMKVKIDTPSKSSLIDICEGKTDIIAVDINTESEHDKSSKDQSFKHSPLRANGRLANNSPKLCEIHKPISSHNNHSPDSHSTTTDKNIKSVPHDLLAEVHPSSLDKLDSSPTKCDTHLYDRHSPVESTQFGHLHPNDHYSPAALGYTPEYSGVRRQSPKRGLSPSVPSPKNKRLHYSQSESYIETLSDKYSMKRSREQGDIAHLQDTAKVYEVNSSGSQEKLLKPRESEPLFDERKLPLVHSAIIETTDQAEDEQSSLVEKIDNELDGSYLEISESINNETEKLLQKGDEAGLEEHIEAVMNSDDVPAVAVEINEPLVTSVDSMEDDKMDELYSKNTRLSVSEGTYSGSEKRSSSSGQSTSGHSISGHSDEYPMVETDV